MKDYWQYRITVDGTQGAITENHPSEQWTRIAENQENRGYTATFEKRLITDETILPLLSDTKGYLNLKGKVICPWELVAEFH